MLWLPEFSLSNCRLSIKACFCPSVTVMLLFWGLCTGVLAGDWRVTVWGRAVELISVEDCPFFVRAGAMIVTGTGLSRCESAARLTTSEDTAVRSSSLCKQRLAQGLAGWRSWRHRPSHARAPPTDYSTPCLFIYFPILKPKLFPLSLLTSTGKMVLEATMIV